MHMSSLSGFQRLRTIRLCWYYLESSTWFSSWWYGHSYKRWLLTLGKCRSFGASTWVILKTSVADTVWCAIFSSQNGVIIAHLVTDACSTWTIIAPGLTIASASGIANSSYFCWSTSSSSPILSVQPCLLHGLKVSSGLLMLITSALKTKTCNSWCKT